MRALARAFPATFFLVFVGLHPAYSQALFGAAGPTVFPGSGAGSDWHALIGVAIHPAGSLSSRLDVMYAGVPGADLVALTGNLVWVLRAVGQGAIEPYLVGGLGAYVKFAEGRFGLNGGVGIRAHVGRLGLFGEVRYHRVTRRFEEAANVAALLPVSVGLALGI